MKFSIALSAGWQLRDRLLLALATLGIREEHILKRFYGKQQKALITDYEMVSLPKGDIGTDLEMTTIVPFREAVRPVKTSGQVVHEVADLLLESSYHTLLSGTDTILCVAEQKSIVGWLHKQ